MPVVQSSVVSLEDIYRKVEADSRFSLQYLRVVDAIVDVTTFVRNNAETCENAIKITLSKLAELNGLDKPLDSKSELLKKSISAEKKLKQLIASLQELGETIKRSEVLTNDAEELSFGIEEAVDALTELHNSMVDLRWTVIEHDADLEKPKGKTYGSVEELITDLKSF